MDTKEKQSLNLKIAKWCGFKDIERYRDERPTNYIPSHYKLSPNNTEECINFCDSMDTHIQWSIPKLDSLGWLTRVQYGNHIADDGHGNPIDIDPKGYAVLYNTKRTNFKRPFEYFAIADTMSIALSLAIEKLIDGKIN